MQVEHGVGEEWRASHQAGGDAFRQGQLVEGGVGDVCIVDPLDAWTVQADTLRSQGKHTPFSGYELPGRVRCTLVGGQVAFDRG